MSDTTIRRSDVMTDLAARFNDALDVPANPVAQEAEVAEPAALNTFSTDAFLDAASGRGAYPTSKDGTPLFRQGDPRWGGRILGHNSTISAAGCAMTSMAMAISKISGKVMNPGELDAWLDRHGGYSGDALMWDKAAQARGLHAAKASWSFSTLNKQLDAGRPVVIGIDHKPGSNGGANGTDHWIALTGRGKDAKGHPVYFANDPATGKVMTLHVSGNRLIGDRNYKSTGQLVVLTGGKVTPPKPPPPPNPGALKGMTLPAGDLERGAKGAGVKALQEALVKVGCLSKADFATGPGIFGPKTEAALKKFQASHGVPSTGNYGPLTRAAFKKLGAVIVGPPPPPPSTGGVSLAQLKKIMPNLSDAKARQYLPYLNAAMKEAHINTPKRQAAFLAQLAHESGEFRWMEELASGAEYEGRRDLGNTHPGDGVRYKGRGPIQLTGRANYRAAGKALGIDLEGHPTRAKDPDVGFRTAAWFWTTHGLNALADKGNFREITHRINGGFNGEASREKYYRRALSVLT